MNLNDWTYLLLHFYLSKRTLRAKIPTIRMENPPLKSGLFEQTFYRVPYEIVNLRWF